jgi:hypothetical protein
MVALVPLPTLNSRPVLWKMTYTKSLLDPAWEAVQAKLTLLVVTAVTWKSPGVDGGVCFPNAKADVGARREAVNNMAEMPVMNGARA